MLKNLTNMVLLCPEGVQEHNIRTGQLIRDLLTEIGRSDLIELWRFGDLSPCDYHDLGKRNDDIDNLEHCERGAAFFSDAFRKASGNKESIFCSIASDLCRYHHERWDGTGWPEHLAGDDIPIIARAAAVANAWDHLKIRYPKINNTKLHKKLKKYEGIYFDPEIVCALLRLFPA
ncbi:HD domain-containing protein [Eubacterium maltosivorans]|uniref:HD domain-containing phosphohydrolase n=1 Tax=Eubacterium maltosivorans TaxID=2041044 RepID=UPI0008834103|nr:HD domain-containing protein [Eubacterium maltosivorans]WPK79293.1 hypothetical protein EUMA32_06980 [Eubacterium maltosivorans]SDP84106.1 HD domain-containing protein [Eubacterium maltosivorans]